MSCLRGELFLELRSNILDHDDEDQDDAFDCVVDQGVHLERHDDLVDNGVGQRAKEDAQEIALAARHADTAQDDCRDGVHLIAAAGGGGVRGSVHRDPHERRESDEDARDGEDGDLDQVHIDARHKGTLGVAADGIDLLAVFGVVYDIDEKGGKKDQQDADDRDGRKAPVAEAVHRVIAADAGHLVDGAAAAQEGLVDPLTEILGKGTVDQHGCQGHYEGRHADVTYEKSVDHAAQCAEQDGEDQCRDNTPGHVEDDDGKTGIQRQHGADRQVNLTGQADQAHPDGDDAHHRRVAEDVHRAGPGQAAAGDHIDQEDQYKNDDKAVFSGKLQQRAAGFLCAFFCAHFFTSILKLLAFFSNDCLRLLIRIHAEWVVYPQPFPWPGESLFLIGWGQNPLRNKENYCLSMFPLSTSKSLIFPRSRRWSSTA